MMNHKSSKRRLYHIQLAIPLQEQTSKVRSTHTPPSHSCINHYNAHRLLEGVGAGTPPGEEGGETDSLDELAEQGDADGVDRALLDEGLGDELQTRLSDCGLGHGLFVMGGAE